MRHLFAALTICTLLTVTLASPVHAGLVAFYSFEGNANDSSGNGNHGTVVGATLAAGYEGLAYDFDGVNDFIEIPVNFNPQVRPLLTIGGWANTRKVDSLGTVVSHDNGGFDRHLNIDLRGPGNGYRYSAFTGTGVISAGPDPAPVNQWVFVSARYHAIANLMTLDVDNVRTTVNTNIGDGFGTARIGSNPGFGEFFDGRIDNLFVFDDYLTDAQIDRIRLGGAAAIVSVPEPTSLLLLCSGSILLFRNKRLRRPQ